MPTVTLTLPTAATVITAGLHANNYTILQTLLNGGLDTANWASGLIFAPSKIMQEAALRRDGLIWNGAIWVPTGVAGVYDRATATVDVNTTVAETSIYTKAIAANDMGTTKALRLTLMGDYLHNNGAGDQIAVRAKFGGTTFWNANLGSIGGTASAIRHPWRLVLNVANLAATNSQEISGQLSMALTTDTAPTTGIGGASGQFEVPFASSGLGAIDTTSVQTLDVTVQWSVSSANNSWRQRYGLLEVV